MGFFSALKKGVRTLTAEVQDAVAEVRDRETFQRVVQAAFIMATADGEFEQEEEEGLIAVVQQVLPQYDAKDIAEELTACRKATGFARELGISKMMNFIAEADQPKRKLIMDVALFIAKSDGDFEPAEKQAALALCQRLSLNPRSYSELN